jgi:hypothetical protein
MSETPSIISVGQAAAWLQTPPQRIEQAAQSLGVRPAMLLNRVPHFHEADIGRIGDYLQSRARTGLG